MKSAALLLLLPTGFVAVAWAGETSPGLITSETKSRIREGLPTYQASASKSDGKIADSAPAATSDVLALPKLTITEKRLPREADDYLMSRKDFNRKMQDVDQDNLARDGALEALLNGFAIPLFSPSRVERGKALYLGKELDRLADLLTPDEAQGLNGMYDEIALVVGRRAPKRR